ncbi:glycoside hydrolase family 1 protein [Botryobasidium botryosum FD-172 SS1]|uniref:Glycoside hydrolase family 1 protein n=1 Tax=Botryobasidium botryosum (strain FD-172 SS1) TaxID=930990 RepID=A0A067MGE3_BOTB1|nr:glycoside hydrolase family 1 protein [Botryobasidium botryosum FD-172 SS1]
MGALATLSLLLALRAAGVAGALLSPDFLFLDGELLPDGFSYGCGTSAYQIEGAWNEDGKVESVWDHFAHDKGKGHIAGDQTGDLAMDFRHTYKKDLPLFRRALGINLYDFTIAWTRVQTADGKPNQRGIEFYRDMMKTAAEHGMQTSCTLYHWDLPQRLQDKYHRWISKGNITRDFRDYAELAYNALGDLCDTWVTMNEPHSFCSEGYGPDTESAPGYAGPIDLTYQCMHNALLAHSAAVQLFREKKAQGKVRGKIGIKLDGSPGVPLNSSSQADIEAVTKNNDFGIGWVAGPITSGDYPPVMRTAMGDTLPKFTEQEKALLKGSYDFIGFDAYTSQWVTPTKGKCVSDSDAWPSCIDSFDARPRSNQLIGRPTGSSWNFQQDTTVYDGLKYLHERWGAKELIVGENGMAGLNETQLPINQFVRDADRIEWYRSTLLNVKRALHDGIPLTGFVPWSCISNLEWSSGYYNDFGLIRAKPGRNQTRTPKQSAAYLKGVLTRGNSIEPYNFVHQEL